MISRTKTIRPIIPPPDPYFQAFCWMVTGAPMARVKKANWRRRENAVDNILRVVTVGFYLVCLWDLNKFEELKMLELEVGRGME